MNSVSSSSSSQLVDNTFDKQHSGLLLLLLSRNVNNEQEEEEVKVKRSAMQQEEILNDEEEDRDDDKNKKKKSLIEQSLNSIRSFINSNNKRESDNPRVLATKQQQQQQQNSNNNSTLNETNNNNNDYENLEENVVVPKTNKRVRKQQQQQNQQRGGENVNDAESRVVVEKHYHHHHYYNHYYGSSGGSGGGQRGNLQHPYRSQAPNQNYLEFKLGEIINPHRDKTFADNLYAQVQDNSNRINLFYMPPTTSDHHQNSRPLPSGSFPLNQKLVDYYNMQQQNRTTNTTNNHHQHLPSSSSSSYSQQQDNLDYVNANKVLNEFYLNAGIKSNYYNETVVMPRMMSSELFLIMFVLTLWLLSVLVCLKRYSLFICFHKRDVPFYDASLINVKLNLDESTPSVNTNVNNNNAISNTTPHTTVAALNRSESAITAATTTHNNYKRLNSSRSHLIHNQYMPLTLSPPGSPFATTAACSCVCDTSDENKTMTTVVGGNVMCHKCNLMKQSMSTNLYFFNQPPVKAAIKSISNGNFCKPYTHLRNSGGSGVGVGTGGSTIGYSANNKLAKNRYNLDFSNDYIYNHNGSGSGGAVSNYPSSSLMSRATAGVGRMVSKQASRISNLAHTTTRNSNKTSSVVSIQKANQPPYSTTTTTTTTHFMTSQQMMLARKRAIIRNKHLNLMSLDENALNLYRDHHRMLATNNNNNQLTIPENGDAVVPSMDASIQRANSQKGGGGVRAASRNSSPKQSHKQQHVTTVTTTTTAVNPKLSNIARLTANMPGPHANFISLRSGSDSMQSSHHGHGLLRPGVSCDYDQNINNNSNDLLFVNDDSSFASLSQHRSSSQYLQLPGSISQQRQVMLDQHRTSSSPQSSSYIGGGDVMDYVPVTTSQRPINPISSLRRHMFATSRRHAQTTVDHSNRMGGGGGGNDSLNAEEDYYQHLLLNAASASFGEFVPMNTIHSSHSQSVDTNSVAYDAIASSAAVPPQMMTSFIETIDECHNDEDLPHQTRQKSNENEESFKIADTSINVSNYDTECNLDPPAPLNAANEVANNPNLLDPTCIPLIVRRTLLEMHSRATMSKSESNIKFRSSNHLLHAPNKPKKETKKKKKPLSLQNSQDKTVFHSVVTTKATTPITTSSSSQQQSGNYLNMVYDELKSKFFRNNSVDNKSQSGSGNSASTSSNYKQHQLQQSSQLFVVGNQAPTTNSTNLSTTNYHNSVNIISHNKGLNRSNPTIMTIVSNTPPSSAMMATAGVRHHSQPPSQPTTTTTLSVQNQIVDDDGDDDDENIDDGSRVDELPTPPSVNMTSSRASGLDMLAATSMSSESDVTVILNVNAMDHHHNNNNNNKQTTIGGEESISNNNNNKPRAPSISLIMIDDDQVAAAAAARNQSSNEEPPPL